MSDSNTSWFHCGRCGTLFRSSSGEQEDRLCTNCGSNPSLGIEPPPAVASQIRASIPEARPEQPRQREKHVHRKRRGGGLMFKLIAVWVAFIGLVIWGARVLWPEEKRHVSPTATVEQADIVSAEDQALLNEGGQKCADVFSQYLSTNSPELRNQFVQNPVATASRMARFYTTNPVSGIDPRALKIKDSTVVHFPDRKAIEIQWDAADGKLLDAVFTERNGEWKLDWEHHVRYSDVPWPLYLAGSGEDEGEFRLLARERLAEERRDASDISLVFYAPRFGYSNEAGYVSPEFLVPRASENGRKLEAAFKLVRAGKRPFGVKTPTINPEGLIRVRVKVTRDDENMERRFELKEVLACHWYSTDAPGMEIPGESGAK